MLNKIYAIHRNWSSFLLYSKTSKDSTHSDNALTSLKKHQIGFYNRNALTLKKMQWIWKNYLINLRIIPAILTNKTFILLYSKVPTHFAQSDTPQYKSKSHNLVSKTVKHWKLLRKITRIWNYQNIRKTLAIIVKMFLSTTFKDPKRLTVRNTDVTQKSTFDFFHSKNIKCLWKKTQESEEINKLFE